MNTGISTACLYPLLSEESLGLLLESGFRRFEFFINAESEAEEPFLRKFKAQADAVGASFVSVHPFTAAMESMYFFGEYGRREGEGVKLYRKFFSAASYLGANKLVLHGQHISRRGGFSISEEDYFLRYQALREIGLEYGVKLCQENVQGFRSNATEFISQMHNYLGDSCNFVFDIKQTRLAGVDPYKMIKAMGTALSHVHLSDYDDTHNCLLPGEGKCDFLQLRKALSEVGFDACVVTEVYKNAVSGRNSLINAKKFSENIFENH